MAALAAVRVAAAAAAPPDAAALLARLYPAAATGFVEPLDDSHRPVLSALAPSRTLLYLVHDRPGAGAPEKPRVGVAVFDGDRAVWHEEEGGFVSVTTGSGDGGRAPRLEIVSINRNLPPAILASFTAARDGAPTAARVHRQLGWVWAGREMRRVLTDEAPLDAAADGEEPEYQVGAFGPDGWAELSRFRSAGGQLHLTRYFHVGDAYLPGREDPSPVPPPLALRGPLPAAPPAGGETGDRLARLAALEFPEDAVVHRERWGGPRTFRAEVRGGWTGRAKSLVLVFRVTAPSPTWPRTTEDLERTDRCEVWLGAAGSASPARVALSPGNFSDLKPFACAWTPGRTVGPRGVSLTATRTGEGYAVAARIDPEAFSSGCPGGRECRRVCFAAVQADGVVLASTPFFRWNDVRTFNRLTYEVSAGRE